MEVIKNGETIGRIHEDYCRETKKEIQDILESIAQMAYIDLHLKDKTA